MDPKYAIDFPDEGDWNWNTVQLIVPDRPYYHGHKIIGVVTHDNRFVTNGLWFEAGEFVIIDVDPLGLRELQYLKNEGMNINTKIKAELHYKDVALIASMYNVYLETLKDKVDPEVRGRLGHLVDRLGAALGDPEKDATNDSQTPKVWVHVCEGTVDWIWANQPVTVLSTNYDEHDEIDDSLHLMTFLDGKHHVIAQIKEPDIMAKNIAVAFEEYYQQLED